MLKPSENKLLFPLSLKDMLLSNRLVKMLILFAIGINTLGLCFPILGSNDSNFYSVIAKHIVISGDWINLTFAGSDWLDKPHLPFWLTAISYKLFGINAFAYILPGFVFNLVGALYTYRLAKHLYGHETGMLACLVYLTSLHLMLSSIDVRAEAFLMGEIMPACYYWLIYQEEPQLNMKSLSLGALFTGLAMMTKGPFVLVTITSGLITLWVYTKKLNNLLMPKWLFALGLSFAFLLPELIVLYLQFDLHPEKVVFSHTHVSGVKFFFWDSQFGRFFDDGPITSGHHPSALHYLFFVHTFLWAFLPWSAIFIVGLWYIYKTFKLSRDIPGTKSDKYNYVYLLGSFLPTFILFSATPFQLDHYTNILIPFAAIISANWMYSKGTRFYKHPIFYVQTGIAFLLTALVSVLSLLVLNGKLFILSVELCISLLALFGIFSHNRHLNKAIVFPVLSISLVFVFVTLVNGKIYAKYDAGYQIAQYLKVLPQRPIIDYQANLLSLEFNSPNPYLRVNNESGLLSQTKPYYLVIPQQQWVQLKPKLTKAVLLNKFAWINQAKFISTLFNSEKRENNMVNMLLLSVPNAPVIKNPLSSFSSAKQPTPQLP